MLKIINMMKILNQISKKFYLLNLPYKEKNYNKNINKEKIFNAISLKN